MHPLQEGVYVAVAGKTNDELDEVAAEAWAQAAHCATARLGSPGTDFRWTAILAPPSPRIGGMELALEGDATIGVFRQFEYDLWGMRTVSRGLLRRAVQGELPTSKLAFDFSNYPSVRDLRR